MPRTEVADEITGVDPGIRGPNHPAVKHAAHADVVNEDGFAGGLGRNVDARDRLPDNAVAIGRLDLNILGEFQANVVLADHFAITDAAVMPADQAILDHEVTSRNLEPLGCPCQQEMPCLGGGLAKRHG
jgi:hypothetical protein